MNDTILEIVPEYGLWLITITTYLSCLAIPVPASLIMIAGGAFSFSGDLSLVSTATAAYCGAVAGDQSGYAIGRRGKGLFLRLQNHPGKPGKMLKRADTYAEKWGRWGVFFSTWLVSPLGPYVNFIAGAAGLSWIAFTIPAALGEVMWVSIYVGLGYTFSSQIDMIADFASNISALLVAALIAAILGRFLFKSVSNSREQDPKPDTN